MLLRITEEVDPYCKHCGSKNVAKIISRVAVLKSEDQRLESMLDPSKFSDLDENDPRSVERVMRRMGRELGDELGEGFEESMEEALSQENTTSSEDS